MSLLKSLPALSVNILKRFQIRSNTRRNFKHSKKKNKQYRMNQRSHSQNRPQSTKECLPVPWKKTFKNKSKRRRKKRISLCKKLSTIQISKLILIICKVDQPHPTFETNTKIKIHSFCYSYDEYSK